MMIALLLLGAAAGQPATIPTTPKTKQCPDGSVVLATQSCIEYPDHRFLQTHEPARREFVERWWCGKSDQPHEVAISVELRQPDAGNNKPYYASRLTNLSVNGRKPSARLLQEIGARVKEMGQLVRVGTRCLNTPSLGVIGVLTVSYQYSVERAVEFELRP